MADANGSSWPLSSFLPVLAFSLLVAWLTLDLQPERFVHPQLLAVELTDGGHGVAPADDARWQQIHWWDIPYRPQARWLRFTLDPATIDLAVPALALSGPFSARVLVNGAVIGQKGTPGLSAADEDAGPIDAVIQLPIAAGDGPVDVLIHLSAFHAGYAPARQFHALGLRNFTEDPRRRPKHYFLAITQAGLLAALMVAFGARTAREHTARWAVLAALAALVALGAEGSRMWINYPYPWQGVRQFLVWLGLSASGLCLAAYVRERFRLSARALLIGVLAIAVLYLTRAGADTRTASGIAGALALVGGLLIGVPADRRREATPLLALLLPWPFIALWNAPAFLDNAVYLCLSLMLSLLALQPAQTAPKGAGEVHTRAKGHGHLKLENESLAIADVVAIAAAGNYVEVTGPDGAKGLYRASLSGAIAQAPHELLRVHRSHAVNRRRAQRLRSHRGSRYTLELDDGSQLPVGRSFVDAVRDALDTEVPQVTDGQRRLDRPSA